MAIDQLSKGNDDGTVLGQSASDKIAFFGGTPVVQQATAPSGTDAATVQTLANALKTALDNLKFTA